MESSTTCPPKFLFFFITCWFKWTNWKWNKYYSQQTLNVFHWRSIEISFSSNGKSQARTKEQSHILAWPDGDSSTNRQNTGNNGPSIMTVELSDLWVTWGQSRDEIKVVGYTSVELFNIRRHRDSDCIWMFQHPRQRTVMEVISAALQWPNPDEDLFSISSILYILSSFFSLQ